jgi:mono/diheme cytochrome c family protein
MTNLKVAAVVVGMIALFTMLANTIPQVQSEVPQELSFSEQVTPEELAAAGEELFTGAGNCTACHGLGTRAPNLLTDEGGTGMIGERCNQRIAGRSCKEYLHESLIEPNSYVVEGYQPIMPDIRRTLSELQAWALVAYLESVGGEVTVTHEDLTAAEAASGGPAPVPTTTAGGTPPGAGAASTASDPVEIMRGFGCLACHQLGDEGAPIGPSFDGMGGRLDADGIRRGILEPAADTAAGYESMAGIMPQTFGQQLTAAQLEAVVRYLSERR